MFVVVRCRDILGIVVEYGAGMRCWDCNCEVDAVNNSTVFWPGLAVAHFVAAPTYLAVEILVALSWARSLRWGTCC